MQKGVILVIFFLSVKILPAQEKITDCVRNIFLNADSAYMSTKNPLEEWKACVIGKPMTDFSGKSIAGDPVEMKKMKGKIVVLNFWMIDCRPCIAELPALNKLVEEYKGKNIEFLAMTWETPDRIREDFLKKYKLDFTIVPVETEEIEKLVASGYPTTYIIDDAGIIKTAWNGGPRENPVADYYNKAKTALDELLKNK